MKATGRPLTNRKVERIPASGIRRFFDLVSGVEGVISLGVGEPDFVTPERFREVATPDASGIGLPTAWTTRSCVR